MIQANSKNNTEYRLAVDIGASSGRHIVGIVKDGKLDVQEVYRFPNGMDICNGHKVWDVERLFQEVKRGLKLALEKYPMIKSMAIDTWGVDYVLMDGDKEILPCYAYRDKRTGAAVEAVREAVGDKLYSRTGIQFQDFNTIYQLCADKENGRLAEATDFLMIPEYLNYRLTGKKLKEYTNATTTGLINLETKAFDRQITDACGLPQRLFCELHEAGETVGMLLPEVAAEVNKNIAVKLCASHDTACAFEAVSTESDSVYVSSGTWSLVGVKLSKANVSDKARNANFANEGGVGYVRFLKNIVGMWFNVQLAEEFRLGFVAMEEMAKESDFNGVFDVCDDVFVAPLKMSEAIKNWFEHRGAPAPVKQADYIRTVYLSLAAAYKTVVEGIEDILGEKVSKIYIVGGGAKNKLLNGMIAKQTQKEVVAIPIEATAIGNLRTQAR